MESSTAHMIEPLETKYGVSLAMYLFLAILSRNIHGVNLLLNCVRIFRLNAARMVFWLGLIVIPKKEETGSTFSNVLILIKKKKSAF